MCDRLGVRRRKPTSQPRRVPPPSHRARLLLRMPQGIPTTSPPRRLCRPVSHIPSLKRERTAGRETTSAPSVGHILIKGRFLLGVFGGIALMERHLDSGSGHPDQATAIGNPLQRQSPASVPAREINADHSHTDSQGPVYKALPKPCLT